MRTDAEWRLALTGMEVLAFGNEDTPELTDELAGLVAQGRKTATCGLQREYEEENEPLPRIGDRYCVIDSGKRPVCVIEIAEVRIVPFGEVDADFARDEGEGDLSLEYWREAHEKFFSAHGGVAEGTPLVCERFRVLHVFEGPWTEETQS